MSLLICKFASAESKPEKIHRWIEYLDQVQQRQRAVEPDRALLTELRSEAERWLQPH